MLSNTAIKMIENLPAILSVNETADFFVVSYQTIYRLIRRKELSAYKDDENNWCITHHDLKHFCSKNCNL